MEKAIPIIVISFLIYFSFVDYRYEIETDYKIIYFIISYIFILPIFIKDVIKGYKSHRELEQKRYFSKRKQEEHEKKLEKYSLSSDIIGALAAPAVFAILVMPIISYEYTDRFGKNVFYTADVYDKEIYRSSGKYSHTYYYVRVKSKEFGKETIEDKSLYEKVNISSKISIIKRQSPLGNYIHYKSIGVVIK
ncbi:hypothetical protein EXH44_07220 [Actinobacillus indolicus]|uniref:Uncharacterized protein n=1 Tax=Actinobacillus indolicus TaxID=51049 RepID=A0A4P7CGA5_9PAST|nr:hypothetical protein [Actinobacillus indolicus]QBQ64028.1 hypothetical protein EXH44_07220 [Actinobacillus indolicus]